MNNFPEKEIKFVASYLRVSGSKQEEEKTIDAQRVSVQDHAKKHSYLIIKEYKDEAWSGDTLSRPDLDQLRLDAKSKIWDAILIHDPDRLARQGAWQEVVIEELLDLGIPI